MEGEASLQHYEHWIRVTHGSYHVVACVYRVSGQRFCAATTAEVY